MIGGRRRDQRQQQHAGAVLQPPHRAQQRTSGTNRGRRTDHRQGGALFDRRAQYPVGRGAVAADARPTNFSVVRIKRDLFRRSNIGVLYTRRDETQATGERARRSAIDACTPRLAQLNLNGYCRPDSDAWHPSGRRQLPGPLRLQHRPLRRAGRTSVRRSAASTRGRSSCAATDFTRQLRGAPVQPAAGAGRT